jgi:hypothetical protein
MPINTEVAEKVWYRYAYARDNGHYDYVKKANTCEAFFRGDQWNPADIQQLHKARRPALTINKIISTVGNVMGEQIYNRSEIAYRPRTGAAPQTAETLTKVFKQISDANQLDWRRSDMFADGIIGSRGYLDIRMCWEKSLQGEVEITNLNPKNVVIDNDADEHDPDSWNEVFVTKWLTADDIAILYSKQDAELLRNRDSSYFPYGFDSLDYERDRFGLPFNQAAGAATGSGYDMSPVLRNVRVIERQHRVLSRLDHFVDPRTGDMRPVPEAWDRNRIVLVKQQFGYEVIPKMVKRIRWTVISDSVVLHDDWSPYKHFTPVPYFPYFRRGQTIGLVENLVGPQELLNKVSSQELHVVNTTANSGYKVKTGALTTMSIEELEARGAETGLVIEMNNGLDEIEKILPNPTPTGLDRISYKAEEHIKTISGVSDSQQGMDREDVAAKAIQQKRQAASTNMAKPLDSLVRTDFMIARNVLDLVQEYYTDERILTITHDRDGQPEQVAINQVQQDGSVSNDLMIGEYDVVISSVPQRETLEDSQFDQAVTMKKDLGLPIPDSFIIKTSRLLNKNDLIKQMDDEKNSAAAQAQAQLQQRAQEAEISKTEAETQQKTADAGLKQAKAQKEGVATQKEAQTPIESATDTALQELQIEQERAEHEMQIKEKEFALRREELVQKMQLEREKAQQDMQLKSQAAAQKAVTDRIAATQKAKQPQPTQGV